MTEELSVPARERLPRTRNSRTYATHVGELKVYATMGEYADGRLGELFITVSKQGSTLSGVLDAWAIAVSLGLQYGVPLESYVKKYVGQKFEPHGMTNDEDVREAMSVVDYVFRRIALDYLPMHMCHELGVHSTNVAAIELE